MAIWCETGWIFKIFQPNQNSTATALLKDLDLLGTCGTINNLGLLDPSGQRRWKRMVHGTWPSPHIEWPQDGSILRTAMAMARVTKWWRSANGYGNGKEIWKEIWKDIWVDNYFDYELITQFDRSLGKKRLRACRYPLIPKLFSPHGILPPGDLTCGRV